MTGNLWGDLSDNFEENWPREIIDLSMGPMGNAF